MQLFLGINHQQLRQMRDYFCQHTRNRYIMRLQGGQQLGHQPSPDYLFKQSKYETQVLAPKFKVSLKNGR
jgi:hypothetical protein